MTRIDPRRAAELADHFGQLEPAAGLLPGDIVDGGRLAAPLVPASVHRALVAGAGGTTHSMEDFQAVGTYPGRDQMDVATCAPLIAGVVGVTAQRLPTSGLVALACSAVDYVADAHDVDDLPLGCPCRTCTDGRARIRQAVTDAGEPGFVIALEICNLPAAATWSRTPPSPAAGPPAFPPPVGAGGDPHPGTGQYL